VADLLNKVGQILPEELQKSGKSSTPSAEDGASFADLLRKSINETNELQADGEKAATDLATGQVKDLHQAAIAIDKAETSMKLMLEVRNKAVSAYKEILRTQM